MVLRKIKRLLGLGADEGDGRSERDVTVQDRSDADAESEAAVKGTDESSGTTGDDGDEASDAESADEAEPDDE
ncbi:DUF4332 domain-containing protein, partial [Halolamina salina]